MEPISDYKRYNSNNGVITDCELLRIGTAYFFIHPKNQTLENHFFYHGFTLGCNHYAKNDKWRKEIFAPTRTLFKGVIAHEIISAVQMGLRPPDNEFNEKEYDKFDHHYWVITKAVEYKRDAWAFFLLFGNIQGEFNGNRFTEERFIAYLNLFPKTFLNKWKDQLEFNFNYFDERGFFIKIDDEIILKRIGEGLYPEIG